MSVHRSAYKGAVLSYLRSQRVQLAIGVLVLVDAFIVLGKRMRPR